MKKVLVIEDETPVRENLVDLLDLEGYAPIAAQDGEEGLRLAMENRPDVIICDISMPRMNGFEVLDRINQDPMMCAVPFIILTARSDREDQRRGMNLGADDYIVKPFTIDEVLNSIQARLMKRERIEERLKQNWAKG